MTGEVALCRLEDIADGEARGFILGGRAILVARRGATVFGYVNSCPHTGVPLDWTPDRFMSWDGRHLLCATHGALFQVENGVCLSGPCVGAALTPVGMRVAEGQVLASPAPGRQGDSDAARAR